MKKKDLLVSALGLSIGLGIMYMGKAKIIKNLIKSVSKKETKQITNSTDKFDYNNPKYHSQAGYWKSGTTGIFYLPLVDDNGVEYDYAELKIENDGKIEIPLIQAVKAGIFFWK